MALALQWLASPYAVQATETDPLDVGELLREHGTVYMVGRNELHTASLLAAFNGYIAREARKLAALQPDGRLDPFLLLALDEAARVTPVPLPDWSGDFGGTGITIIAVFQSRADLIDRWGDTGASKILNNCGALLVGGLTKDPGDLKAWATLLGERDATVETTGKNGRPLSRTVRLEPVISPAQLASLPKFRVVVFRSGMQPAVARLRMVWHRRDTQWSAVLAAARITREWLVRRLSRPGVRDAAG
jgi:type IV secretion system protein VirD4